jgi:hypothetical protein
MCILIGYIAKRVTPRPSNFELDTVREIASVSNCIAKRPDGWIDLWKHNDWWVYDSPELAREVARDLGVGDWPIVAYRVLPIRFEESGERTIEVESTAAPMPGYFQRLGWDVASKSYSPDFECSPLSCNRRAVQIPVNALCLIETKEEAVEVARLFAREQPEPGAYFVVEVWRELFAA